MYLNTYLEYKKSTYLSTYLGTLYLSTVQLC